MRNHTGSIADWFIFGGIFSIPVLLAQTDLSILRITSIFSLPLHIVAAVSAFFTVLWSSANTTWRSDQELPVSGLIQSAAEVMIIPVMFYCELLFLFSEALPSVLLYGSTAYLSSISFLFLKHTLRMT